MLFSSTYNCSLRFRLFQQSSMFQWSSSRHQNLKSLFYRYFLLVFR